MAVEDDVGGTRITILTQICFLGFTNGTKLIKLIRKLQVMRSVFPFKNFISSKQFTLWANELSYYIKDFL